MSGYVLTPLARADIFDINTLQVAGIGDVGMSTGVEPQLYDFEPRFGLAYRVNSKTVVRTGYGLSHFVGATGFTGGTLSTQFPVIYNIQSGTAGDYRVAGTLNSIPAVPVVQIPGSGILSPAPDQAYFYIPSHNPMPAVHSFNFTIERELGWGIVLDVGYVGDIDRDLPEGLGLNTAAPGGGAAGRALYQKFGRTANTIERAYAASSSYNSLQTNLKKRFAHGLMFTAAYTYSKAMGYGGDVAGGGQIGFQNNINLKTQYAPLSYDQTHVFVASQVYELPVGKGKKLLNRGGPLSYVLGNWQLNGILTLATGTPFTVTADATSCNCPGNSQVADALRPATILGGVGPGQHWFETSAFGQPGPNRFGTSGLNTVRGPGRRSYDFSLFKNFAVTERAKLEFRTEFYNLTNTPVFGNPAAFLNAGNFGQISSASNSRTIQFGMRMVF